LQHLWRPPQRVQIYLVGGVGGGGVSGGGGGGGRLGGGGEVPLPSCSALNLDEFSQMCGDVWGAGVDVWVCGCVREK